MADAEAPFNTSQISLSVTSGTSTVTTITDCGTPTQPGCNEPSGYLLQGRSITWYEAYPVVPGTRLTIEVDNLGNFSQTTPPIFDGTVF
ncbi:hypothetical protein [Allobranchiibius sp. GilTou73]|uniref:hypothetical protein n=1 Tax=Allobranchiibius sp. GilTou73 TaxID=2904523 RepID=UPI001F3E4D33|nr:hypothetical protein [Allobranchiibius sp. GilTou73]UIJ35565.1 hypothetical protein LVQ62_04000 [Allobranchiibius sp. GilTou73]